MVLVVEKEADPAFVSVAGGLELVVVDSVGQTEKTFLPER